MKTIKLLAAICLLASLQSCYKPGKIRVQNNITQVTVVEVKWGDIYIAQDIMPGETSGRISIDKYEEKLPASHKISFKMMAKNRSIYLETEEQFILHEDDDLLIVLNDDTIVSNPNE